MATGIDVGAHLRAVRTMYGMSQRELARRAGVTNGLISLMEQNRVSPSVSSLKKVLDGIPMSLAEFFTLDLSATPQVFFARNERRAAPVPQLTQGSVRAHLGQHAAHFPARGRRQASQSEDVKR
jgi:transcriptional regulator with XRE-family HTH domain